MNGLAMFNFVAPIMGLAGWHAGQKQTLAQQEINNAAQLVWEHAWWSWRLVSDAVLTTTAAQSYIILTDPKTPANAFFTDCGSQYRVNGKLCFQGEPENSGIAEVNEIEFQKHVNLWAGSTGRPRVFCMRQRNTGTLAIPVYVNTLDFAPTPSDAFSLVGFQYLRTLPPLTFNANDAAVFPYPKFDILWKSQVVRNLALLAPAISTFAEERYSEEAFNDLLAKCEATWAPKTIDQSQREAQDTYGDLDDLGSTISFI